MVNKFSGKHGLNTAIMTSLKKMRIPFIIFSVILILQEVILDSLKATRIISFDSPILTIGVVTSQVTNLGTAIFYAVNGYRVMNLLRAVTGKGTALKRVRKPICIALTYAR